MSAFQNAIEQAKRGQDLSAEQTSVLIDSMLSGQASEDEIGLLLLALKQKGESVNELVGAAQAMRRHMTKIPHSHDVLVDTCGTGGSESGTFNISTAIAIVTAAGGVAVAKHGNRRATSLTGSADVLEELGVPIESDADSVARSLDEIGICFCFAVKLHPAMKHVVGVRRKLGVKTLFNLLGPLCNPAGATHQLLGTSSADAQQKMAAAIAQLNTAQLSTAQLNSTRAFVVHGEDGQDEVSLDGATNVVDVANGIQQRMQWTPTDFGLLPVGVESLRAENPSESAGIIRRIFDGEPGPCRDTVVAGTAAAFLLAGAVDTLDKGARKAAETIDSGAAKEKLASLANNN